MKSHPTARINPQHYIQINCLQNLFTVMNFDSRADVMQNSWAILSRSYWTLCCISWKTPSCLHLTKWFFNCVFYYSYLIWNGQLLISILKVICNAFVSIVVKKWILFKLHFIVCKVSVLKYHANTTIRLKLVNALTNNEQNSIY